MLNLLLTDSEIELVPLELASHPAVRANAAKRKKQASQIMLDSALHHSAMRRLAQADRRGRPDIVHFFLLLALESALCKRGHLNVFVHTRNDELITIDPKTRLPKSYARFVGLMESLFIEKAVPSRGEPLLQISEGYSFERCFEEVEHSEVMVLSERGRMEKPSQLFKGCFKGRDNPLCVVGGFSRGDFRSDVYSHSDDIVSIFDEPLTAWTVASELIVNYENAISL